jgi:predicted permease
VTGPRRSPPRLGRLLVRLRGLGARRADVESDLWELYEHRAAARGPRHAAWRYTIDALSLWTHARPSTPALALPRRGSGGHLRQDFIFAWRLFRRQPGLFGVAIGGLTLAIGLSTAVFSIVNAAALRGDGIRDSAFVYRVGNVGTPFTATTGPMSPTAGDWAHAHYARLRALTSTLDLAAAAAAHGVLRLADGQPLTVDGQAVSGNYFSSLGGTAAIGRTLAPSDDAPGAQPAIVIGYAFWKNRLEADASIVGTTLWLDDQPYAVAGVAGRGFVGPTRGPHGDAPPAFWISLGSQSATWAARRARERKASEEALRALERRQTLDPGQTATIATLQSELAAPEPAWNPPVQVFGRLAAGVTREQAFADLSSKAALVAATDGRSIRQPAISLGRMDAIDGQDVVLTSIVLGLVMLVVLLAAANVTNVLLASAAGRAREIGTRLAIGASRSRIVRQLLTESLILGAMGGALGLLLAEWLTPTFAAYMRLPPGYDLAPDGSVFAFVVAVTVIVSLAAGLSPVRYIRHGDLMSALKTDRLGSPGAIRPGRLRSTLVGCQAAASVVLLVIAALFTHSVVRVMTVDLGFRPDRLISVSVPFGRGYDAARTRAYWDAAVERVRQIPAVASAAVASGAPFNLRVGSMPDGRYIHRNLTSADYFDAIGTPIVRGRAYTADEVRREAPVAVISASLAHEYWGAVSPLGASLERVWGPDDAPNARHRGLMSRPAGTRIIGVVANAVSNLQNQDALAIYTPLPADDAGAARLVVRARGDAAAVAPAVRDVLRSLDASPGMTVSTTLVSDDMAREFADPQMAAVLASIVGIVALALAAVGLFGVTAFVVGQRQHEVGVRMTLGASGADILGMLLRDGLRPVAIGLGAGLVLALGAGQVIRRGLYGISGHDPIAIAAAVGLLLAAAGAAILIPARRAARIDPARMLRE